MRLRNVKGFDSVNDWTQAIPANGEASVASIEARIAQGNAILGKSSIGKQPAGQVAMW